MTFFLNEYDPAKQRPAQGPDMAPVGVFEGIGAMTSMTMRNRDASFRATREVMNERQITAEPIARRIGIDDLNAWYQANDAGYDHLRPAPTTVDDFFAMHGPLAADIALDIARTSEPHNPDKWKDLDLTDTGIEARVNTRLQAEDRDEALIRAMMPRYGGLADLVGGIVGSVADVRILPFLFAGGGGGSFLRMLGREAALNTVAEAVTLPSQFEMADRLGKPAPDVLETLATAALGGAAFGAVFEGIPRAISGLRRGIEYYRLRSESVAPEPHVQAATQAAEDAIIAGEDPFKAVDDIIASAPDPQAIKDIGDALEISSRPDPLSVLPSMARREPLTSSTAMPASVDLPKLDTKAATESAERYSVAKAADPDAFRQLEEGQKRISTYRRWLSDMANDQDAEVKGVMDHLDRRQATLEATLAGMKTGGSRRLKDQIKQIARAREDATTLSGRRETRDMAQVRRDLMAEDQKIRDLAPRISAAYRATRLPETPSIPVGGMDSMFSPPVRTATAATPSAATRPDDGLFDIGARAQMEVFSDQTSPKARETQQAMVESLRDEIQERGDFKADMGDGKGERSAASVLKELDDDMEFLDILDACGKVRSQP